jgi:enoyl-CoA hydratase/carnithine racemase
VDPLLVERAATGVVTLTLNVPDRRNAMTEELTAAWASTVAELSGDDAVRCVVVTGAGSAFCAGGNLSWIADSPSLSVAELRARMRPFYDDWLSVRQLEVPVVAAVNGPAIGAGLCLALAADLRYAAHTATLSAPFSSLGMHAGMGATWLLPEAVGLPAARELLYTGRTVAADEALRLGLVNGVFPADSLVAEVRAIADRIAAAAPVATRLTKAGLARGHPTLAAALEWEGLAQPVTLASEDLREGIAAFREKRPPRFTGR